MTPYLDFMVRVSATAYGEYTAEVVSSPAGETATGTPVPDPLQITALRSKLAAHPSESGIQRLGTKLFETLLTGEVLGLFRQAQALASTSGFILRLSLILEPYELSALPWELLFDPEIGQFLALSRQTPLVRSLPLPQQPQRPLLVRYPLRILAVFPNPIDLPPVDIRAEREVLQAALLPLIESGMLELELLEQASVGEMVQALVEHQIHILYYQGHVGFNPEERFSYLLLEDKAGHQYIKGIQALSYTLDRTRVRLAVIHSRGMSGGTVAYDLVRQGIPAAVATQEPLGEGETTSFLRNFSEALVRGLPVDAAVAEGRRAIFYNLGPQGGWASPILVVRQPDAALFSLEGRP